MNLNQLGALALVFVVGAFIISIGASILTELQGTQTSGTYAYNVTDQALQGTKTFGDWLPMIALVIVASIVIGIVVVYMGNAGRQ